MTYWQWVMLGRIAGSGLPPAEEYQDKMDVLQSFMVDVLTIFQAILALGLDTEGYDAGLALEEAGCKFMVDIGYEDYAIEIITELQEKR